MNKQEQQNLYKELITSVIVDDRTLSTQGADFEFKTMDKLILRVGKRQEFKSSFETVLKKQKVPFESKLVSGSSFQSTVIDFTKYFRGLKPLTVMYKEGGGANSDKLPKVKTAMQERGAAYIFEQSLVKNVDYDKKIKAAMVKLKTNSVVLTKKVLPEDVLLETFKDDLKKLRELFEVKGNSGFPYIDWLNSFYFSQKVLLAKYSSSTFQRFERDGGFMDYVTKLIKDKFGISQKDTWNPADVWAVRGTQQAVEKYIDDKMKKIMDYKESSQKFEGAQLDNYIRAGTLYLNSILIDLLTGRDPKVVGISLKLTDSGAHIEEVNFDKVKENIKENKALIDTIADPFIVDPKNDFICNFEITSGKASKGTFTQDVKVSAEDAHTGDRYNFQIKANSSESTTGSNLKFELTIQGKGAARGGKVPVELVVSLVNKIQRGAFENDYKKYPRTSKEFLAKLTSADKNYKKIFEKVKDNVKDIGVTYAEFTTNVTAAFNMGGAIATNATCKLMGLEFLYFLLTIKENQMRGMVTDMAYLAQKKNIRAYDTFGPFIKIS
jgi:hypothetical protein